MDADIAGALAQIESSWKAFEYNGEPMTKNQVKHVLEYGIELGYTVVSQLTDVDIKIALKRSEY
jgi:hypothetical protein